MMRPLCVALLVLAAVPASGQSPTAATPKPFLGRVAATWDDLLSAFTDAGSTFEGGGPVTYMGNTRQAGDLFLSYDGTLAGVPGTGSVTITAEDGDTLTFAYEGLLDALNGEGIALFHFTAGTGKFAKAKGGGALSAYIDISDGFAAPPMAVILVGEITY